MVESQDIQPEFLSEGLVISQRYVIEQCLGSGGMGSVYLVLDRLLENRKVALKVLHKDFVRDRTLEKRFLREVQLMHMVNHPNVVRTFDAGRDGDLVYFTMEYILGTSLDEIRDFEVRDIDRLTSMTLQICQGLEAIHAADIVHRDLKPGNIIVLKSGELKITDFGVARPKASELTQHNEIIGSVDYMAPEVWLGKGLTPAVDFYSLGIILYRLVTGRLPFENDQTAALMWMHVKRPPIPPKSLRPEIPAWLNQLILKLLAKLPEDRPRSCGEIINTINTHALRGTTDSRFVSSGRYSVAPYEMRNTQQSQSYGTDVIQVPPTPSATRKRKNTVSRNQRSKMRRSKAIKMSLVGISTMLLVVILYAVWFAWWFLKELLVL